MKELDALQDHLGLTPEGGRPITIDEPGIYPSFPESVYHADPCPEPSLSSSIAKTIVDRSPAHAKQEHVRLTPREPEKPSRDRDMGSAAHALVFGGAEIDITEADGWTKKADQQHRAECYAAGKIPLITADYERAKAMADAVRPIIIDLLGDDFLPEAVIAWREGSAWCRTMLDGLARDLTRWVDLKTSGAGCGPDEVSRRFFNESHDIQAGFQSRGLDALDPKGKGRRKGWFVYVENDPPHGVTVLDLTEGVMQFGRRKARVGIEMWRGCMSTGKWPSYPAQHVTAEMPVWSQQAWMKRETEDAAVKDIIAKFGSAVK